MLISIPAQDGRGKGLSFKLSTLHLQSALGWDTVHAARVLANSTEIDDRDYSGAVAVLRFFGVCELNDLLLITGNPEKERALHLNGFRFAAAPPMVPVTPMTFDICGPKVRNSGIGSQDWTLIDHERTQTEIGHEYEDVNGLLRATDPDPHLMPKEFRIGQRNMAENVTKFLAEVVDLTGPHVCAYKFQKAFYDAIDAGDSALAHTINHIKTKYPEVTIILDCKAGDIQSTMRSYVSNAFDRFGADALVVNPLMADDVFQPFAVRPNKLGVAWSAPAIRELP